jgi:hypothetical protein
MTLSCMFSDLPRLLPLLFLFGCCSELTRWLAQHAEEQGVDIFPGFAGEPAARQQQASWRGQYARHSSGWGDNSEKREACLCRLSHQQQQLQVPANRPGASKPPHVF